MHRISADTRVGVDSNPLLNSIVPRPALGCVILRRCAAPITSPRFKGLTVEFGFEFNCGQPNKSCLVNQINRFHLASSSVVDAKFLIEVIYEDGLELLAI